MKRLIFASLLSLAAISAAYAQVTVKDPWVRATVPAQTTTGAYMQISAAKDAKLVQARSPVAGMVEIHEMAMAGDVMKMRAVREIDLPAGKIVELGPDGYHIMLMKLKGQVKDGDIVPLTLIVENKDGKRENVEVKAVARALADTMSGEHHHHHH